jgi:hypothetical protein
MQYALHGAVMLAAVLLMAVAILALLFAVQLAAKNRRP